MARLIYSATVASAVLLSGCAVHPLPEDYQKSRTFDIVQGIRCEARRAIEDNAIDLLRKTGRPADIALAEKLLNNRTIFRTFKQSLLEFQDEKAFYKKYIDTGLALNFTFDLSEANDNSTELDLAKLITNGSFSLKATAKANFERSSNRQFLVSDTFGGLLTDNKLVCPNDETGPNFVYPVAGTIGLKEVLTTFVELNEVLSNEKGLATLKDKSGVLADQLTFTTTIGGSLEPQVMLNGPGSALRLTEAFINTTDTRTDVNTVIVGLSLSPEPSSSNKSGASKKGEAPQGPFASPSTRTIFSKQSPSAAEAQAIEATVQKRYDTFLQNFGRNLPQ